MLAAASAAAAVAAAAVAAAVVAAAAAAAAASTTTALLPFYNFGHISNWYDRITTVTASAGTGFASHCIPCLVIVLHAVMTNK